MTDKMPLARAHFTQMLVTSFLVLTPFATFSEMGYLSPLATFIVTLFFQGLLNLSKLFLDPFDNSKAHCQQVDPVQVNTLIQESNIDSIQFWRGLVNLPKAVQ
mmetsp:Transcript_15185/g.20359  ORF Transcript_15185/g.20359 Transcript_15185/m.20359 type:complete len:103 (-) Transcript_15185:197-505(-)